MNAIAQIDIEPSEAASEIGTGLTVYQPFRAALAEFAAQNATLVFDYEDPKGNKAARSHVHKLRQSKSAIDQARKEEKAASLEYGRKVDAEAKAIIDEINVMIEVHQKPLDEIEQREKDRIDEIKTRIANDIRADHHLPFDASVEVIAAALADVKAIPIDAWFGEFLGEAAMAKDQAVPALERRLADAQKREAEIAEIERLRRGADERDQRERDERIAREAAEQARRETEAAAERQRLADEAKARAEREEIERKAREEREAAEKRELGLKLETERAQREKAEAEKREAEAVEAERRRVAKVAADKAAEEAARQADERHRNTVHHDVIAALTGAGLTPIDAQTVLTAVRDGKVPHVRIAY